MKPARIVLDGPIAVIEWTIARQGGRHWVVTGRIYTKDGRSLEEKGSSSSCGVHPFSLSEVDLPVYPVDNAKPAQLESGCVLRDR